MRLLIVSPNEPGVSETFIRAHLDKLPHDVVAVAGYDLAFRRDCIPLRDTHAHKAGFREARWLNLLPRFLEFIIRRRFFPVPDDYAVARAFLLDERIEIVLAEYGTAAAFVSPLCKALEIPLVAHFHGFDAGRYDILKTFSEPYRQMFASAAAVISVSNAMSEALIEAGCPSEKIKKNPYGPAPEFFDVVPDYQSNTVIAVGRQTAKKAPYLTIDAFRRARERVPDLRLIFIGDGELFEVSEALVRAWGLESCVELIGAAGPEKVREAMGKAFAFVQHSTRARNGDCEGMPVAILEAGAAGLPVVSTRHAGIPEVIIQGETGFLGEPGDTGEMAARIVELAEDRDKARRFGAAARERIRENYSLQHHLHVLDCILQEALTKGVASSAL